MARPSLTADLAGLVISVRDAGMLCIRWSNVQAVLASFVPPECIHLDSTLDTIELLEAADGRETVRVGFMKRDGTPQGSGPVVADLVIGADGIRSAVRGALVGDGPPRDHGGLPQPQTASNPGSKRLITALDTRIQ